tara:strand:+ start:313 stop:489 length:177 start_codon:yes stop_codon:yes gene_type:complete
MLIQAFLFTAIFWLLGASRPQAVTVFVLFCLFYLGNEAADAVKSLEIPEVRPQVNQIY